MIAVGGLLLGAVLTAPGALGHTSPAGSLADPFDPSIPRATLAQQDEALGLRDPFDRRHAIRRRADEVGRADLRDPFGSRKPRRSAAAPPALPASDDLRSPFASPPGRPAARRGAAPPSAKADLRDPFGA